MLKDTLYYSKILLFGEYGIIENAMGLSIPYHFYKGKLLMAGEEMTSEQKESNLSLRKYLDYLADKENGLDRILNLEKLSSHISFGLYFDSSIPQGFGVGSSGALVAAIYDTYAVNPINPEAVAENDDLLRLKQILSSMESFFHGKSSGLDPLICYLNLPILVKGKTELGAVAIPDENAKGRGAIFLMDSGAPGKTQGMVSLFLQKLKDDGFRNLVRTRLKKYNDECVKAFLKGDTRPLFDNLKELSSLFLENFRPMIPDRFESLWRKGIETNAYYLKLCGSGGGGFVLGFTEDLEKAKVLLKDHKLQVIHQF
jgi:mevalonate kinase